MHESQGIVRLIVTLSEYDLATEQRETALSSQAEIYIIGGLLRRDCPGLEVRRPLSANTSVIAATFSTGPT